MKFTKTSPLYGGIYKILEIFFPSHCLSCEKIISKDALFCNDCWLKLEFITEPKCRICSYPFEIEIKQAEPVCLRCQLKKPSYDKALTIFCYNDAIKKIIGNLKYHDQTFIAKKFAKLLLDKIAPELGNIDLMTIVPLHKKRLKKRKFNQVALIGKAMFKKSSSKFFLDILLRTKNNISQVKLGKTQRERNLKNIFMLNEKYRDLVKGKNILLLDDVMTTGATLEHCAKVLKKSGVEKVFVLTVAKTVFR